jgi:hypothetical protein
MAVTAVTVLTGEASDDSGGVTSRTLWSVTGGNNDERGGYDVNSGSSGVPCWWQW